MLNVVGHEAFRHAEVLPGSTWRAINPAYIFLSANKGSAS